MEALKVFGTAKGLTAFDRAGLENEHSDLGGHEIWEGNEPRIVPASEGRRAGCPTCGFEAKARTAAVTEGKKGVCRKPKGHGFAPNHTCVNCGELVLKSTLRRSGWSHVAGFAG